MYTCVLFTCKFSFPLPYCATVTCTPTFNPHFAVLLSQPALMCVSPYSSPLPSPPSSLQCPKKMVQEELVQAGGPVSVLMVDKINGCIITAVRSNIQ